jgi:hypothetical protein
VKKKAAKCDIWRSALYGAETMTLEKVDQKYVQVFAVCWGSMLDEFCKK